MFFHSLFLTNIIPSCILLLSLFLVLFLFLLLLLSLAYSHCCYHIVLLYCYFVLLLLLLLLLLLVVCSRCLCLCCHSLFIVHHLSFVVIHLSPTFTSCCHHSVLLFCLFCTVSHCFTLLFFFLLASDFFVTCPSLFLYFGRPCFDLNLITLRFLVN